MPAGQTSDSLPDHTLYFFTDLSVDERAQPDAAGPSVFNCMISIALVFSCMYC